MIYVCADQERSIRSVVVESKKLLHIPLSGILISVGTLIPIRDTRMIPETLKTKNSHEK